MNVRQAMARLNASAVKFDVGRGGIPELTPQDIAAAVGMCRLRIDDPADAALAPEVFWWLYGPEGVASYSSNRDARALVLEQVHKEFQARYQAASIARLAVHTLEFDAPDTRRAQPEHQRELERAKSAFRQVHSACWPARDMSIYRRIVDVVALEFRSPRQCPECGGRTFVTVESVRSTCPRCNGTGLVSMTSAWRAAQMHIGVDRYKKTWRVVYEWVYNYVDALQVTAAHAIGDSIGDDSGK